MVCLTLTSIAKSTRDEVSASVIVFVDGKLHEVPFTPHMTLTKAILSAGGYGEFSRKPVYLERHKTARRVDLRAIIDGRRPDVVLGSAGVFLVGRVPTKLPRACP